MKLSQLFTHLSLLTVVNSCTFGEPGGISAAIIPVGVGDRFNGGAMAPRGLGSQPVNTTIGGVMNVVEIQSAIRGLVNKFGIDYFTAPAPTHEGASMFGGMVGDLKCPDAYRVYLIAGIHARERGGPDNLIYFIADLLWAASLGTGLTYGGQKYSNADVLKALSAGIVFMPLTNPDGVAYDQVTNSCWRRNRNPAGFVDLNRNFDFLWDFPKHFATAADDRLASNDPRCEVYHGTAPFSEPETRNIKWVMDTFPKLRWFLDLHSYASDVLYNWGDDSNQASQPTQSFQNAAFDGKRGVIPDRPGLEYQEYIDNTDWSNKIAAARKVANGMQGAAGRPYLAEQSASLYATSGDSIDYAYSRTFANSSLNKIHGFTVEFGVPNGVPNTCSFYPTPDQFRKSVLETGAGYMEFLLAAVDIGHGDKRDCSTASTCANTCAPGRCGGRATCEVFNPIGGAPNFGKRYCFCQAGYKATGVADADASKQYHVTWQNSNGNQTHRVLVNPGQDCWDVCKDNRCSEVPLKDGCR